MKANLYLSHLSFPHDEKITVDAVSSQIIQLFETCQHIRNHATVFHEYGDDVYKCDSVYDIDILDLWECEFCDLYSKSCKVPKDVRTALLKIIDRAKETTEKEEELILKIKNNNESSLNGFLCINKNMFDKDINSCLIYHIDEWYQFHRDHLAEYWISEEYFYRELVAYFENIFFHERVEKSLKSLQRGGLKSFSKTIIFNLTQLNDKFDSYSEISNLNKRLKVFSSDCGVVATLEGDASRKPSFTFLFYDSQLNSDVKICCEPHMKLENNDNSGDTSYNYNRIYFYQGSQSIEDGKILVGHIGKHL